MTADERVLNIATSPEKNRRHWKPGQKPWQGFITWLDLEHPADRKDCGGYMLGELQETTSAHTNGETGEPFNCTALHRNKDAVTSRSALALDADSASSSFVVDLTLELDGTALVIYTTWSHTPASPRYRVVTPLSRDVSPDEYTLIANAVMTDLGWEHFDHTSNQPSRLMHRPSTQGDYQHYVVDGDPLDADVWITRAKELGLDVKPEPVAAAAVVPARPVPEDVVRAQVARALADIDEVAALPEKVYLDWPGVKEPVGWDMGFLLRAGWLVEAANSGATYTLDEALADFMAHAPASAGSYDRGHKWDGAVKYVGTRPIQHETAADVFDPVPSEAVADRLDHLRRRFQTGGSFIFDGPEGTTAVWGRGDEVLWAEEEPLIITGSPGVGKTTVAQQIVLSLLGVGKPEVLGYPVAERRRVLYLAMDRPKQIKRSFARMVTEEADRAVLDERLVIWRGPPPEDIATNTGILLDLARAADADAVVVDSLKDAALNLSDDSVGGAVNRAFQTCVAASVEVLVLHHQIKRSGSGSGGKPVALADVYGSAWITAGAGSVILIHGEAGDTRVQLLHLKPPADTVGPLWLEHDHYAGTTRLADDNLDPLTWLRGQREPATVKGLASALAGPGESPTAKHIAKAGRDLERLARTGLADKTPGTKGGEAGSVPATYRASSPFRETDS